MAAPLLALSDIHLTFGGTPLLEGAELAVFEGERLCLVGRNGSGKSSLLKVAAGEIEADRGERVAQQSLTIRYLPQEPDLTGFATTLAYVEAGLAESQDPHRARMLLSALGLTGEEAPGRLSGGEARRAALARVIAPEPDVLLLDEPTNHLDLPAIEWLEGELATSRSAIVLISHDRRFLERLSRATVWIDRGRTRRLDRGFAHFEAWRDELLELEEQQLHKLERRIERETQWMHYGGVTARRRRNEGRRRRLVAMRDERRTARAATGSVRMTATEGDMSGKLVIEAKAIAKSFGGRPIVRAFSTRIGRGDRVGIVGPNGAGKTTLLALLTGALAPDAGGVRLGAGLQMISIDQGRETLDPEMTLQEALTGGRGDRLSVGGEAKHVMSYMKDFLFAPEQARSPLRVLSGGERGRLTLARALVRPSNLLVLDEPTNDLDLETLDLLEELIDTYQGTVILVSHDRDFLDRVVTSVIAAEGDGRWVEYAGGYSDMLRQRAGGPATAAPASRQRQAAAGMASALPPPNAAKRKLTFKETHALDTLPGQIEGLQNEQAALQAALADPGFYARDPRAFTQAAARAEALKVALAAAEERWLALEILREELGG